MTKNTIIRYSISTVKAVLISVLTYISTMLSLGVDFKADYAFKVGLASVVVNALLKALADWNLRVFKG